MKLIMCQYTSFLALLLAIAMLLSACSNDDTNSPADTSTDPSEIHMNADVWQMPEGTRATFYGSGTLSSGSFTASAYLANSTTAYISPVVVNREADKWVFSDGKHYWPASEALDFFAYMPEAESLPSYITSDPTYSTARNPQFTCTALPMTYDSASPTAGQGSGLNEFVFALKTDRTKALDGADGVVLNFQHPFARLKFQLSASHPNIKINSITFKNIKNNGSFAYTDSPLWTTTGSATNLVVKFTGDAANFNDNASSSPLTQIGPDYIMIPQEFAGNITVNATWIDWGEEFAHDISTKLSPITWRAGYSYTYTFTITTFDLRVDVAKFTEQW